MSSKLKKLIDEKVNVLNNSIQEETNLFSLPPTYIALSGIVLSSLYLFYNNYKSKLEKSSGNSFSTEEDLKNYILSLNDIKTFKRNSFNEYSLQTNKTLLEKCSNPNTTDETEKIFNSLGTFNNTDDIIKAVQNNNELNNINSTNTSFLKNNNISISNIFLYAGLLYVVYELITEIQKSKFPSPNRINSLLYYIKSFYNDINLALGNTNPEWNITKPIFEKIFILMTSLLLLSSIYKFNRKKEQSESVNTMKDLFKDSTCVQIEDATNPIIESKPLNTTNVPDNICSVNEPGSSNPIPQKPFEIKQSEFSCDVSVGENLNPVVNNSNESVITNALIQVDFVNINVNIGEDITEKTVLGAFGGQSVYSPVIGKVTNIDKNNVYITGVSEPDNNLIISKTLDLNNTYTNIKQIKDLIINFYLQSSYPILLSTSSNEKNKIKQINTNVSKIYDNELKNYDNAIKIYNKNIQQITSKDNIETQCNKENIQQIKIDTDKEEQTLLNSLITYYKLAKNVSKITTPLPTEFSLVEYYFNLLTLLQDIRNPQSAVINYINIIHDITAKRYYVDGYDKSKVQGRINDFVKQIEGISNSDTYTYFKQIDDIWNNTQSYDSIKNYLVDKGNKNTNLQQDSVEPLANKIVYLYKFYREVVLIIKNQKSINVSNKDLTTSEAIIIEGYFNQMWKILNNSDIEIQTMINDLENTVVPIYTYDKEINNEQYSIYVIPNNEDTCSLDNDDPYLTAKSKKSFKDFDYWLKYCTYATLTGVANPLSWSTGIIAGTPVTLPVVYIPIKGFQVSWGVMCLGITVCGIYPFPFLLMGNLSNNWQLPIGDITKAIKNEIKEAKKLINTNLKELKNSIIQPYIDSKNEEINSLQSELNDVEFKYLNDKANRPSTTLEVAKDKELIATLRIKLFNAKKIYTALVDIKGNNTDAESQNKTLNDPKITVIDKTQKNVNKQFDRLDSLLDKLQNLLIGFPAALAPNSANFGPTAKNPKPKIEIKDHLDETINTDILNGITKQFKITSDDYTSTKFESKTTMYKKYLGLLSASMILLIKNDPFPKYENLKITNIAFLRFLNTFVISGSSTFGIPGQLPAPL